jgi:hypothetical protein
MKSLSVMASLVALLLIDGTLHGEGLIVDLPEDGTWAEFDLVEDRTGGPAGDVHVSGTLKVSSVGRDTREGEPCRWIEFVKTGKRNGRKFTDVDKLLLREKDLARTGTPLRYIAEAFHKSTAIENGKLLQSWDLDAETVAYFIGKLHLYLHGPFESPKKLDKTLIESKLGKLECEGISGHERRDDKRRGVVLDTTYTIRLHKSAPFGVVTCDCDEEIEADGKTFETITIKMKLSDFGKGAKSSIPEAK